MYMTCECLNVFIKCKGTVLFVHSVSTIELSASERAHDFFNHREVGSVKDLENIKNQHPGLIEIRNVGSWAIHRCCNCQMYTHAIRRQSGAVVMFINTGVIMNKKDIAELRASSNYSPIFRIVINERDVNEFDPHEHPKFSVSQLAAHVKLDLRVLDQQLEEGIQQQIHLVDKKIRAFTREQYQILDEFRERIHNEHTFLARLIYNAQQTSCFASTSTNLETPPPTPESFQLSKPNLIDDIINTTERITSENTPFRQNSPLEQSKGSSTVNGNNDAVMQTRQLSSYDGDILFVLEDMEDVPFTIKQLQASDQELDSDVSEDEEIDIPMGPRVGHPTLAKSLPVSVPAFHSYSHRLLQDDDEEQISRDPMDPNNIQASIKALAKSVHGDTVFGDLPRPRFSTQI
ncbi:PREDICTED: uncharacterized protein LOC105365101 [Ceratosolen solmsi marchali]|uniref:Uncharacterized protein LOC105365101 n=1 Tax=Ceratosolen solmsi marchali TaxID=326594 RepID=A0AAJ7DYX1_9HYME|nr:PREDICTED: uncharacterized protein LOC105365101 [Ceratosolen solmsi marchali]